MKPADFEKLAEPVEQEAGERQICLVLEPTGSYHLSLVAFALDRGWDVALPNPKRVQEWAAGMGYRVKHDRADARKLAHYGALCQPPPQPPVPPELVQLDNLLKRQQDVAHLLRQERNRHHALEVRPTVDPLTMASVQRTIAFLEAELEAINHAITSFFDQQPEYKTQLKRLRQLPGVGPKNSPHLLLLLCRWNILTSGQGRVPLNN